MSAKYHDKVVANAVIGTTESEAWAVGKRDGVDVITSDPVYHNNSKYYASLAEQHKSRAVTAETNAKASENAAKTSETNANEYYEKTKLLIDSITDAGVIDEKIEKAVNEYIKQNPIETLTEQDVQRIVVEYVTEHKDELKGEPGYTPVKGTDYWTAEDIAEIQSYIDNQIGGALNGSY